MLEALLFDLDGTLADTDSLHLLALQQLLAAEGRDFTREEFKAHATGRANADMCRYLFPDRTVAEHEAFADRKEVLFRELSPTMEPLAGLTRLLDHAEQQGIGVAVVTNAPRANAVHMLKALCLEHRLTTVVVADELERAKPDPLPYLTGLQTLGASAPSSLAFEDSVPGVTAAVAAGLYTIGLATSQTPQALLQAGASLVIDNFEDARLWEQIELMSAS